jgi:hypothetical protein
MKRILAFVDKYWKLIIIILLSANIFMLVRQEITNNKNDAAAASLLEAIDQSNRKIEKNEKVIADLKQYLKDSSGVKVIQTTIDYEKIKTAPLNTNISDKQLRDKLRKFESEHNIRHKK